MNKEPITALFVFSALISLAAFNPGVAAAAEDSRSRDKTQSSSEKTTVRGVLDIDPWSVDSGGGESSGGTFTMVAAVGQPDAGLVYACGRVLDGGVWSMSVDLQAMFCDGFESADTGSWASVTPISGPSSDSQTSGGE